MTSMMDASSFTNEQWRTYIKQSIEGNDAFLERALLMVYNNQTAVEKRSNASIEYNGLGFDRNDAKVLTAAAERVGSGQKLAFDQYHHVKRRLPRYWRQIMDVCKANIASWASIEADGADGSWKRVKLLRYPTDEDWIRCKIFALNTIGKKYAGGPVTDEWKHKILTAEHSPIRTLMFTFEIRLPYYTSVHFARHKYGIEHYVGTQRNDRQDNYDRREAPQGVEVVHMIDVNAQELMAIARRRLCAQADVDTRRIATLMCAEAERACPEFKGHLVPMCEYQGRCPEFKPCGRIIKRNQPSKAEQMQLDI